MLSDKRILVLMSSYNGEKYIDKQIKSIMQQTIARQIDLRIRDDGSTDSTCEIIKKLAREYPERIELICGKNIGYNGSFLELLNGADGYDYYSLCDQDDVWLSSKLEVALRELCREDDKVPLLYASTSFIVNDNMIPYGQTRRKTRPFTIYNAAIQNICPGHTQVLNNALLRIIQRQKINSNRIYVYDSWIAGHAVLYGKILFNNSSFTYYRQHKSNQLGTGAGKIGQLFASVKRNTSGDGHKYREQVEYFMEKNEAEMKRQGSYGEFERFLKADRFGKKLSYLISSKLYRQSKLETIVFYLAVLSGNY